MFSNFLFCFFILSCFQFHFTTQSINYMVLFNNLILSSGQFVLSLIFICLCSSDRLRFVSVWLIFMSRNIINFMPWSSTLSFCLNISFRLFLGHCLSSGRLKSFFFQRWFFTFICIVMLILLIIVSSFRFVLIPSSRSISFFFQFSFSSSL